MLIKMFQLFAMVGDEVLQINMLLDDILLTTKLLFRIITLFLNDGNLVGRFVIVRRIRRFVNQ